MPELLDRLKTALSDRYAIEEELGAGGMATVYLAEDLKHKRKVAVKVLRSDLAAASDEWLQQALDFIPKALSGDARVQAFLESQSALRLRAP